MIRYDEPYYTTSPFGTKQGWVSTGLLNHRQMNEVKKLIETDKHMRPAWFYSPTITKGKPGRERLSVARTNFDNQMICFAHKTSQHLVAVTAYGKTQGGWWHPHSVISGERGKIKRMTQTKIRRTWKQGISDMRRYDPNRGGVIYTLRHEHIVYDTKVYCPHGGCHRCEKFQRDYVKDVLRASATSTSDEASSFGVTDPLQVAVLEMRELRKAARRRDHREYQRLRKLGYSVADAVDIMKRQRAELLERTKPK